MAMVDVFSQRILVDNTFSVPKCLRLARMSHHSHRLLRKILGTVPKTQRDDLSEVWGEELLSLGDENRSNFERQNAIGKPMANVPMPEEDDVVHEKMMDLEPLLEASGERNLRSIEITHGECPCHCLAPRAYKLLLSVGCRRNSVNRVTGSSALGDHLGSKHDAGVTMDRRKCDEVQGVEEAYGGIDTRYRLQ